MHCRVGVACRRRPRRPVPGTEGRIPTLSTGLRSDLRGLEHLLPEPEV